MLLLLHGMLTAVPFIACLPCLGLALEFCYRNRGLRASGWIGAVCRHRDSVPKPRSLHISWLFHVTHRRVLKPLEMFNPPRHACRHRGLEGEPPRDVCKAEARVQEVPVKNAPQLQAAQQMAASCVKVGRGLEHAERPVCRLKCQCTT